jgi:GT2 family glycosyltransferase
MATTPTARAGKPTVTAVVVAHRGDRWLPGLRAALTAQTRPPDLLVGADTSGAEDPSAPALREWLGPDRVVELPPRSGFGAAVQAALDRAARPSDWVWLLHDDCAPAPTALAALLTEVARDPEIAVAGPKVLGLGDRRLLLEVGVTIARSGRRETGLERREQDQGQHDGVRRVLAVGTAGMLIRRDVWDELRGFDPALPLLRDDVDLGWRANLAGHGVAVVTDAVVYHAEATSRRRRRVDASTGRLHRLDRQHAIYVLLANLPLSRLLLTGPRLTLSSLVRSIALLAGKRPGDAADEVLALLAVLGRPDRLVRARWARRRTRAVPSRTALPLLAPLGAGVRHGLENLSVLLGTRAGDALGGRHRAASVETGPTSEEAEDLPSSGAGWVRRALLRPSVVFGAGLVLITLVASRGLFGEGRLMGGALLPAPAAARGLWHTYLAAWHPVGLGSDLAAPPYLAVLAALGTVLGGAGRAVDLIVIGAVPLAGLTAFLGLRPVVRSGVLRVWGAASYALLPPVLGAVAAGRLGTAIAAVLLPLVARALVAAFRADAGARGWRATWSAGLLLGVVAAFVPVLWAATALCLGVVAAVRRGCAVKAAAVLVVPPLLLLPWLPTLIREPGTLLLEAGLPGPGLAGHRLDGLDLLLLRPGGPGLPPLVVTAGLVLAALAALLRRGRRRPVLVGWGIALLGLAGALALSRVEVTAATQQLPVPAWPGPLALVAGGGLVLAAVAGAAGARARVAASSFGWRQPAAVVVAVAAALGPVATAGWWLGTGAGDPVQRRDPVLLPAFVAAEGAQPARPRTLVLRARADGSLAYAVLRSDGPRTGDAELVEPEGAPRLDAVVADLASGRGGDAAARLVPYGVRFVLLARPAPGGLARAISAVPGLDRLSGQAGTVLWQITYRVGRVRVLAGDAPVVQADGAPPPATIVPAAQVDARARIRAGAAGRLLVLADRRDPGWRAGVDGKRLERRRYDGWAQAFELPSGGGQLRLQHDQGSRAPLLWAQLGLVVIVVVLALPAVRPAAEGEDGLEADLPEPATAGAAT